MTNETLTIAERIADARIGAGMTAMEAAKRLGVKEKTLHDWESGKKSPRANKLQIMAGVFNVSLIWLLNGREDLDPIDNVPDQFGTLGRKIRQIKALQAELSEAVAELDTEFNEMREKSANLDLMAEESMQHWSNKSLAG